MRSPGQRSPGGERRGKRLHLEERGVERGFTWTEITWRREAWKEASPGQRSPGGERRGKKFHLDRDRLEERGVERGSARRSSLKGRERAIVSQTNIGTVSKATLGKLLIDGVERIDTILN